MCCVNGRGWRKVHSIKPIRYVISVSSSPRRFGTASRPARPMRVGIMAVVDGASIRHADVSLSL